MSKKLEHKKKFDYNHVYKHRMRYNPSDHNKLKKDKIEHYKQEQQEQEKNNSNSILQDLINNGILSNSDMRHTYKKNNNIKNTPQINIIKKIRPKLVKNETKKSNVRHTIVPVVKKNQLHNLQRKYVSQVTNIQRGSFNKIRVIRARNIARTKTRK